MTTKVASRWILVDPPNGWVRRDAQGMALARIEYRDHAWQVTTGSTTSTHSRWGQAQRAADRELKNNGWSLL